MRKLCIHSIAVKHIYGLGRIEQESAVISSNMDKYHDGIVLDLT